MNLSGVLRSFKIPGGITVTRAGADSYIAGINTPGATSNVTIDPAVVVPMQGKELMVLPEGLRTKRAVQVGTEQELRTAQDPGGPGGDTFVYDGDTFEVQKHAGWSQAAGFHWSIATKVDVT